jgi:uncharacterized protein YutE (UPF0331/DUF86 family)
MFHEEDPGLDKELIITKLSKLQQYLEYLKELRKADLESFINDFKTAGAVERYLQVSIECMIDIGNEIISSLQLQRPERYRDIPYILARSRIIPEGFTDTMNSMIGFRNLLVHDYASINLELVYEFLQTRLEHFQEFIRYIVEWLQKMSPTPLST